MRKYGALSFWPVGDKSSTLNQRLLRSVGKDAMTGLEENSDHCSNMSTFPSLKNHISENVIAPTGKRYTRAIVRIILFDISNNAAVSLSIKKIREFLPSQIFLNNEKFVVQIEN